MTPGNDAASQSGVYALAMFAYDIAFQIDVDRARSLLADSTPHRIVRGKRPAPMWFDYKPAPVRVQVETGPVELVAGVRTAGVADVLVYDFGAALLTYRIPVAGSIEALPALADILTDNAVLLADSRSRVEAILGTIRAAVERPRLREVVEDYAVFVVERWAEGDAPAKLVERHASVLAQVIEAEPVELAPDLVTRALAGRMSYTPNDMAIVDWNGAVLFDPEPEDVIALLQHANVELLELRVLDQELDDILDQSDEFLQRVLQRRLWPSFVNDRVMRRFAVVQTDAAVLFEGVNNAIKLMGNQYLARLYRMGAERLDLPAWHASVHRKLNAADSIYQKMSDTSATRRLETLEYIIIILIAVSLLLPIFGWAH